MNNTINENKYFRIDELSDFCEKDCARLMKRLNGVKAGSECYDQCKEEFYASGITFDVLKKRYKKMENNLKRKMKDIKSRHNGKLYCDAVYFTRKETCIGIKFEFEAKFEWIKP